MNANNKNKPSQPNFGKQKPRSLPKLALIGVGGALAVGALLYACSDSDDGDATVDVQRARYDSLEACLADWNQPSDCGYVCDDSDAATPASGASAAMAASGIDTGTATAQRCTPQRRGGGAHSYGLGGDGGSGNDGAHGGGAVFVGGGHWYGPYYTHAGTVYHPDGTRTGDAPAYGTVHGVESSLRVRESSLVSGGAAFQHSPHAVSVSEGRAISRGGFMSSRGVHGFGGHGEGGGHGFGGGHGSGGG